MTMATTTAPRTAVTGSPSGAASGLTVTRAAHRHFGAGSVPLDQPVERVFFPDLARYSGIPCQEDVVRTGRGNTFEGMGLALLSDLGEHGGDIDLLILAYSTPDLLPSKMTAPALAELFPGSPLVLAVTDQGRSAPFTALALARGYALRHGFRRALVMAFDQSLLPYATPQSDDQRIDGDGAVALLLEAGPDGSAGAGYQVRQTSGLAPERVPGELQRLLVALAPEGSGLLLAGPGVDRDWVPPRAAASVRWAPAGYPCTALLGGLAERLPAAGPGPVVLVEYDRALGDLSVCRIDPAASGRDQVGFR